VGGSGGSKQCWRALRWSQVVGGGRSNMRRPGEGERKWVEWKNKLPRESQGKYPRRKKRVQPFQVVVGRSLACVHSCVRAFVRELRGRLAGRGSGYGSRSMVVNEDGKRTRWTTGIGREGGGER